MDEIQRLLAIDPGDPHVGLAFWQLVGGRWRCEKAREVTPERYADALYAMFNKDQLHRIACEKFQLGGGQEALRQAGSTFGTVECIGWARHLCRLHDVPFELVTRSQRANAVKRMKAIGWRFPRGASDHIRDAIAVGAFATGWRASNHIEGDGVYEDRNRPTALIG